MMSYVGSSLGNGSEGEERSERVVWVHLGSGFKCWFLLGFRRELGAGFLRKIGRSGFGLWRSLGAGKVWDWVSLGLGFWVWNWGEELG